jgi:tetratricopeptide (TPR) repeat protein
MNKVVVITILSLIGLIGFAQEKPNNFNQAKLHLANHKLNQAIPILQTLWKNDPTNANLNYLLGLCYVKEDLNISESVELLETASEIYATDYASGSSKERRAPEYVYYYLTIAYSKNGQCEEALRSLNKFYQVYTYNDEYYLVDGQKWVRECNLRKTEEEVVEEEPLVAEVVEEDVVEEIVVVEEAVVEEPIVEEQPEEKPAEVVVEEPEPIELTPEQKEGEEILAEVRKDRVEPKIRERLIPFDDWENLRTREVNYTTLSSQYGVQVAALIDLKPTRDFTDLKNVEVYVDENGIFRYVIGRFPYRKQAESLKNKLIETGYKDAFIVDINQPDYNQEVLGIGKSNIDWHIGGKVDFRVQVGAFSALVPSAVASKYLEIDGIREYQQNGLTILTVGNFKNYESAVEYREKLKVMGIDDAFIVAFNMGNKISLKEAKDYVENNKPAEVPVDPNGRKRKADF